MKSQKDMVPLYMLGPHVHIYGVCKYVRVCEMEMVREGFHFWQTFFSRLTWYIIIFTLTKAHACCGLLLTGRGDDNNVLQ